MQERFNTVKQNRTPLADLGRGFFQRVFTAKERDDPKTKVKRPVLVGQGAHDFVLRVEGEDDHAHVAEASRSHRGNHPEVEWPRRPGRLDFMDSEADKREGIRTINGEALPRPVRADIRGAGQIDPKDIPKHSIQARLPAGEQGPCEEVDPIDAAIALTSERGLNAWREECADPSGSAQRPATAQTLSAADCKKAEARYNKAKGLDTQGPGACRTIRELVRYPDGRVVAVVQESPNEARLRWQHEVSPKSFHSVIFGSARNHENVTAYDLAIGGGRASSDPRFHAYLCAVADWRLQADAKAKERSSIMKWKEFVMLFSAYWDVEPVDRKELIAGNADYYSTGVLPACVPGLQKGMPKLLVCETMAGARVTVASAPPIASDRAKQGAK